jgi:PPM family protein phosphatase
MKFTYDAQSHTGQVRELNEDSILARRPTGEKLLASHGDLLVVADGMGGHQAGEIASRQAVETIESTYYTSSADPASALSRAIEAANAAIYRRANRENRHGMGTTVVAAARVGEQLYVAHVGDSRIYLIRGKEIRPLTQDHSLVAEQVAAGLLSPEEAVHHPHRNVISRAVGTSPRVDVDISPSSPLLLQEGDIIVLCSDGLTEHLRPERIRQLVTSRGPEAATHALIEAANAAGGTDNISVIVARVGEPPAEDPGAATTRMQAITSASAATAPMRPVDRRPPSAASPPAKGGESTGGGRSALAGILASLLVLALLGGVGWLGWTMTRGDPAIVPTAVPTNLFGAPTITPTVGGTPAAAPAPASPSATPTVTPVAGEEAPPDSATPVPTP